MKALKDILIRLQVLTWPAFLMAVFIGLVSGVLVILAVVPRDPITLFNVHEVDAVVVRGQALELEFSLQRSQHCDARVERWLWRWNKNKQKYWVALDTNGTNPPTELRVRATYVIAIPVPVGVTPGDWFYWSRTVDNCGWGARIFGEHVRESDSIPITIVNPSAQTAPNIVNGVEPVLVVPGKQ